MADSLKDFLENYQLYRKFEYRLTDDLYKISTPSVNLFCPTCNSSQTFTLFSGFDNTGRNLIHHPKGVPDTAANSVYVFPSAKGAVINFTYKCASCGEFEQHYFIRISENLDYMMKVGQYPSWGLGVDKHLKKFLGMHMETYKKGLACESQSYGIGAFAYYRRIIEETIDNLLEEIYNIVSDSDKDIYKEKLLKTKASHNVTDKIDVIKDFLPPILIPAGNNPLKSIYKSLSKGIHSQSDEECLKNAKIIRTALTFIVSEIKNYQTMTKDYLNSLNHLD